MPGLHPFSVVFWTNSNAPIDANLRLTIETFSPPTDNRRRSKSGSKQMTKKRKLADEHSQNNPINKRSKVLDQKNTDEGPNGSQPKVDPTYGQRGAFPGLDDDTASDDLFYGPADDGLQYLRMVRSEAKSVPNLLVAPSSPQIPHESLYADYPQGFYHDGAYTATPLFPDTSSHTQTGDGSDEDQDPQEAYYKALCERFSDLSAAFQSTPPVPYTGAKHPFFLVRGKNKTWRRSILKWAPDMQLLGQLSQENIVKGLRTLGEILTRTNLRSKKGKYIGVWAWGLLARCREVGQMGSEEVGVLRDLAKQAVSLLRRISDGEGVDGEDEADEMSVDQDFDGSDGEDVAGEGPDDEDHHEGSPVLPNVETDAERSSLPSDRPEDTEDTEESLTAARGRLLSRIGVSDAVSASAPPTSDSRAEEESRINGTEEVVSQQTIFVTLDMIVTIVGEFYGQKDLLNARLLWDELPQEVGDA